MEDEVLEEANNQVSKLPALLPPATKKIKVIGKSGRFGYWGRFYYTDHLDLETAQWLIDKGYPYLKIE